MGGAGETAECSQNGARGDEPVKADNLLKAATNVRGETSTIGGKIGAPAFSRGEERGEGGERGTSNAGFLRAHDN